MGSEQETMDALLRPNSTTEQAKHNKQSAASRTPVATTCLASFVSCYKAADESFSPLQRLWYKLHKPLHYLNCVGDVVPHSLAELHKANTTGVGPQCLAKRQDNPQ